MHKTLRKHQKLGRTSCPLGRSRPESTLDRAATWVQSPSDIRHNASVLGIWVLSSGF